MIKKENLLRFIKELPDEFSLDELMDKILLLHKIEVGLLQSKENKITPNGEIRDQFREWLK